MIFFSVYYVHLLNTLPALIVLFNLLMYIIYIFTYFTEKFSVFLQNIDWCLVLQKFFMSFGGIILPDNYLADSGYHWLHCPVWPAVDGTPREALAAGIPTVAPRNRDRRMDQRSQRCGWARPSYCAAAAWTAQFHCPNLSCARLSYPNAERWHWKRK